MSTRSILEKSMSVGMVTEGITGSSTGGSVTVVCVVSGCLVSTGGVVGTVFSVGGSGVGSG